MLNIVPPELQAFVADEIAQGRYQSETEVVADALRLLREQRDSLDGIARGIEDLEAGRTRPFRAFVDELGAGS